MDQQSYQDGKSGNAMGPNADVNAYRLGVAEREALAYKESGESDNKAGGGGGLNIPTSSTTSGLSFGLILMAPFMYIVYPAGGLLFLAILGVCVNVMNWFHVPAFTVMMSAIVLGFGFIFVGLWAERKISQNGIYRAFRLGWRIILGCSLLSGAVLRVGGKDVHSFDMDLLIKNGDQALGAFVATLIGLVFAAWLIRGADRIYFPVASLQREEAERQATAAPIKPKSKSRRVMIAIAWFIPATLAAHLIIRLLVDAYFKLIVSESDTETLRLAFYDKNLIFIFMADIAVWLLLSIKGLLPGMKK